MYAVDIRVEQGELSGTMSEMRSWLDKHRFEPSAFFCHDESTGLLVSVKFNVAQQAKAFAERFQGLTARSSAAVAELI